jgi:hypothetical protein
VPVSAEMVPGERSKSAEVTEPGGTAQAFFTFELNETTFLQPFTVFVSLGQFAKKFKKILKI